MTTIAFKFLGLTWGSDGIKEEISLKKTLRKQYLQRKSAEAYSAYKEQRKKVKEVKIKRKSWEEFGNKLENNFKENKKLFYQNLRNMRNQEEPVLKHIEDKNRTVLCRPENIMY